MKKLLIALTFVAFSMTVMGQKMVLVLDSIEYMKSIPCNHNHACSGHTHISGICSTEDIGGVMVEFKYGESGKGDSYAGVYLHAANYNSFPVTVLLQISYEDKYHALDPQVVTCVLPPSDYKAMRLCFADYTYGCILDGIIVRKLSN